MPKLRLKILDTAKVFRGTIFISIQTKTNPLNLYLFEIPISKTENFQTSSKPEGFEFPTFILICWDSIIMCTQMATQNYDCGLWLGRLAY